MSQFFYFVAFIESFQLFVGYVHPWVLELGTRYFFFKSFYSQSGQFRMKGKFHLQTAGMLSFKNKLFLLD